MMQEEITSAWKIISPVWPLKNIIACNPLQGLEDMPFEQAVRQGEAYFQQKNLPANMGNVNRATIKWCQAFFDEGQATLSMPYRNLGLYRAWKKSAIFDRCLTHSEKNRKEWLLSLPESSENTITECLSTLAIPDDKATVFLTILLVTLPGWAGYVKYKTEWENESHRFPVTQIDYLAMRIAIVCITGQNPFELLAWHEKAHACDASSHLYKIKVAEKNYQTSFLNSISIKENFITSKNIKKYTAQLVFCIDVRSEPFRRALEKQGNYDTYGFAGFFSVPVAIENERTEEIYASCPVLLKPKHKIVEKLNCHERKCSFYKKILKNIYESLKYSFTTPFVLAEALGAWSGLSMLLKTLFPVLSQKIKNNISSFFSPIAKTEPSNNKNCHDIVPFADQCTYAEGALRIIGLTNNFSSIIVFCGHGSATENNAYATALDCGACGGRHGGSNAKILAHILNQKNVRDHLHNQNIHIPDSTIFIASEHNTTTDDMEFFIDNHVQKTINHQILSKLKKDILMAKTINNQWRGQKLLEKISNHHDISKHSTDWAQTRPEWGLARNASFIIAPRDISKNIDLDGRAFLHSYDWRQDKDGSSLTAILTAPMVVAQWINSQYIFSFLDNITYGSGSKITQNVTGKIGIMQGNGSDLMHGLPLQSLYQTDKQAYHEPVRLMTVVYAPRTLIQEIVLQNDVLKKLFGNEWVMLFCIDPEDKNIYVLSSELVWINLE